mmetsp:Transcript_15638/g.31591  ORF Transcript_15638/g.31591 Transcript_15638/m.31591 type:complete len:88 (+) Transcript_15638:549-812(+)
MASWILLRWTTHWKHMTFSTLSFDLTNEFRRIPPSRPEHFIILRRFRFEERQCQTVAVLSKCKPEGLIAISYESDSLCERDERGANT